MRGTGRLVAVAALATVLVACTEVRGVVPPDELPTIGILRSVPDDDHDAFLNELRAQGWTPGRDVRVHPVDGAETHADVEAAASTLDGWNRGRLDLVIAFSTPFAQLAAQRVPSVPTLFVVNDPVAAGLVSDPAEPDGQTGVTFRSPADRTLHLASAVVGGDTRIGYLWPADDPAVAGHRSAVMAAAEELGVDLTEASFEDPGELSDAVAELAAHGVAAVLLASSNATFRALPEIEAALDRHGLPAIANTDQADFAVVVLSPDGQEVRRQLARQAVRLLGGAEVSAVPVEEPRRFVLAVDRTKAAELGLDPIDPELLRQADVVR